MTGTPTVLFACIHNSGRSVAAQALARHYAGDAVQVRSAGSEPGTAVLGTLVSAPARPSCPRRGRRPTPPRPGSRAPR